MIWDAPMNNVYKVIISVLILLAWSTAIAQAEDDEQLKIAALEALISAPPERALPIARKVLEGSGSDDGEQGGLERDGVCGRIRSREAEGEEIGPTQRHHRGRQEEHPDGGDLHRSGCGWCCRGGASGAASASA